MNKKIMFMIFSFLSIFLIKIQYVEAYTIDGSHDITIDIFKLHNTTEGEERLDNYKTFCDKYSETQKYYACGVGNTNINFFQVMTWDDPDIEIIMVAYSNNKEINYKFFIHNPNKSTIKKYEVYYNLKDNFTENEINNKYIEYNVGYEKNGGLAKSYIENYDGGNYENFNYIAKTNVSIRYSNEIDDINNNLGLSDYWKKGKYFEKIMFKNKICENGDILLPSSPYDDLTLKKTFNSGTNAGAMGKIVWDINAYGDIAAMDGLLPFKIQYGSNDFTIKNIPKFSSYKIYGSNSFESGWTDITNDERFYFDDFNFEKYTLEGSLTETIMTSTLNIPSDMCVYENIKVEFYFDNTSNFYLYTFDDMTTNFNESWSDVEYYFNDYIYYEFPKNTRYAFISSKTIDNIKSKIYFPFNFSGNSEILFGAYIYDYNKNSVMNSINDKSFKDNSYYSYFDFNYTLSNGEILFLERKINTEETPYFYVHKDLFVQFENKKSFSIKTVNGFVDINPDIIDNPYSKVDLAEHKEINSIFDFVTSYIYEKLPIIEQLGKIYNSFQYIDGVDKPPKFNFDMSFMGLGTYTFDLNFDNYRDTFFGYLKILISIYTVLSVLNEVKNIVDGGGGN